MSNSARGFQGDPLPPILARCDCCREMKLSSELSVVFGIGMVCFGCRSNGNSPREAGGSNE